MFNKKIYKMKKHRTAPNAIVWTAQMLEYITTHWPTSTNKQLADALGLKLTTTRAKIHELGLKRMELSYWTEPMVAYLRQHYRTCGDVELAHYYEAHYPKNKPWLRQHIEKKRRYLGLSRTEAEISAIHARNVARGRFRICNEKRWAATGISAEGTVRWWKIHKGRHAVAMIKHGGRWLPWARVMWERHVGPIPAGSNVVFKNPACTDLQLENLELLTNQQLMIRTHSYTSEALSDNYVLGSLRISPQERDLLRQVPELIELKRNLLKIKRTCKQQS